MLNVRRFGTGPLLVALHGFTLTGAQFEESDQFLDWTVLAADLPGHGLSAGAPCRIVEVVDAVVQTAELSESPLPLLGYSQGGRMSLLAVLDYPQTFNALILVSSNAGVRDESHRESRRDRDARVGSDLRRYGTDTFLDHWTNQGLTSTIHIDADRRDVDRRLRDENTAEGLASAIEGYGQGSQPDVWDRLGEINIPTLIVSGERDTLYTAIAEDMGACIKGATTVIIPDSGHNPFLDNPRRIYSEIAEFLDRNSSNDQPSLRPETERPAGSGAGAISN